MRGTRAQRHPDLRGREQRVHLAHELPDLLAREGLARALRLLVPVPLLQLVAWPRVRPVLPPAGCTAMAAITPAGPVQLAATVRAGVIRHDARAGRPRVAARVRAEPGGKELRAA